MIQHTGTISARGNMHRWVSLDLFRILAAASVLANHYIGIFSGNTFYFFATGMFLLLAGATVELGRDRGYGMRYFASRVTRLYPAYLATVAMFVLSMLALNDWHWPITLSKTILEHLFFLLPATQREQFVALNPAFWILPSFIEFYFLVALVGGRVSPKWWFLVGALFVVAYKILWIDDQPWYRYHLPVYLYAFAVGMLVMRWRLNRPQWTFSISPLIVFIASMTLLFLLGSLFLFFDESRLQQIPGWRFYHELCILLQALAFWSILYSRFSISEHVKGILASFAALTWPIYLVHLLPPQWIAGNMPSLVGAPLAVLITVGLAFMIHRAVDRPAHRFSRRLRLKSASARAS